MGVMIVEYDLFDGEPEDYEDLIEAIKKFECVNITRSTWAVYVSHSKTEEVYTKFKPYVGPNDVLSVINKKNGSNTGNNLEAVEFFRKHRD